ncbi:MAG: hypothetical protein K2M73_11580 [Lachnospiraceae bacterium]|nr:hypothetical protein [Lachnospiraceae bacterium]MDE6698193.1 hypothetical protein [Lachnospiraceae bacterium]
MTDKELDKALDIVSALITGEEVSKEVNISLYEEYESNGEVYDVVVKIFKKMNINLYEYNYGLYISAGENNKVFGYTNEELKKEIGVKLNRELYLCYFIIYNIITKFYRDSKSYTFVEYVKIEDIITGIDNSLKTVLNDIKVLNMDEVEINSFKEIALTWEDMPIIGQSEGMSRASRGSKSGFVKLVFNFLVNQELLLESEGRYYVKDRFKALIENYFDDYKGRIYEIMKGEN